MMLLRAREAVMQRFRGMLRENGLTEQQWRVLRALNTDEAIEISALARATVILAPSLSRILPDLAAQHLVGIGSDARDQRRKLVSLTAGGAALIEAIAPQSERIYAEITERFGADRLARLQSLLLELEADLQPAPREETAGGPTPSPQDGAASRRQRGRRVASR